MDELGALDVLAGYAQIRIPEAVWDEVAHHRPAAFSRTDIAWVKVAVQNSSPRVQALGKLFTLHRGEQQALTLCLQDDIHLLLTDDTAARLAASSLQLTAHGTLGLLLRAGRIGRRTPAQVVALLKAIPRHSTLHVRPSLLADVIRQAREMWGLADE